MPDTESLKAWRCTAAGCVAVGLPPVPPACPLCAGSTLEIAHFSPNSSNDVLQQAWANAREMIRNENELQNYRLSSLLTLHGFLFGAFVFLSIGFANKDNACMRWLLGSLLTGVSMLGFLSPNVVYPILRGAIRHVRATDAWWRTFLAAEDPSYRVRHPFPEIVGKRSRSYWWWSFTRIKDEDVRYDVGLSEAELDRIDRFHGPGLHRIPHYLKRFWCVLLAFSLVAVGIGVLSVPRCAKTAWVTWGCAW